jgi:hypothetical protein
VLLRHIWKVQSRLKSTLEVRLISCGQFDTTKEVQGVGPWCPVQISTSHQHHRGPSSRRWLSILIFQRLALLEKPADAVSQPAKLVCFVDPTALCWCGDELYRWCPPRGDGLRLGHRYTCIDTSISISRHADCLLSASDQQHFEALTHYSTDHWRAISQKPASLSSHSAVVFSKPPSTGRPGLLVILIVIRHSTELSRQHHYLVQKLHQGLPTNSRCGSEAEKRKRG